MLQYITSGLFRGEGWGVSVTVALGRVSGYACACMEEGVGERGCGGEGNE